MLKNALFSVFFCAFNLFFKNQNKLQKLYIFYVIFLIIFYIKKVLKIFKKPIDYNLN